MFPCARSSFSQSFMFCTNSPFANCFASVRLFILETKYLSTEVENGNFFISCYFWNSREFHFTFLEVCFARAQTHKILGIYLSFWSPDFGIGSPAYSQDVFLVAVIFATNKSLFFFCSFFCSSKLQIFWINCYSNSLSLAHAARGFSTRFFSLSQIVYNLY